MKDVYRKILEEQKEGIELSVSSFGRFDNNNNSPLLLSSTLNSKVIIDEIIEEQKSSISNNIKKEYTPYDSPNISLSKNDNKNILINNIYNNILDNIITTPQSTSYVCSSKDRVNLLFIPSILENRKKSPLKGLSPNSYDYLLWIISSIIFQQSINKLKGDKDNYIELNSEILRDICRGENFNYKTLIDYLIKNKVIQSDNHYLIGHKSKGFRLTEQYRNIKVVKSYIKDNLLNKRINNFKEKQKNQMGEQYKKVYNTMVSSLNIDIKKAEKYIRQKYNLYSPEYKQRFITINLINDGDIFFVVDKKGNRAHHNLSNIPSDLRRFCSFNGNPIGQVDIVNSQPLFFYCSLLKSGADEGELAKLKDIVSNGRFYEFIMEIVGETNRDVAKENTFKDILFGYNSTNTIYTKAFRTAFPSISAIIFKLKEKDHSALAIAMQKEESKFIFHCAGNVIKFENISTIHDSIVCEVENLEYVKYIMGEVFNERYGFYPKLTIKNF